MTTISRIQVPPTPANPTSGSPTIRADPSVRDSRKHKTPTETPPPLPIAPKNVNPCHVIFFIELPPQQHTTNLSLSLASTDTVVTLSASPPL
jgi:hypothetical protein